MPIYSSLETNHIYQLKGRNREYSTLNEALDSLFFVSQELEIYTIEQLVKLVKSNIIIREKTTQLTDKPWDETEGQQEEKKVSIWRRWFLKRRSPNAS